MCPVPDPGEESSNGGCATFPKTSQFDVFEISASNLDGAAHVYKAGRSNQIWSELSSTDNIAYI